MLNCLDILVKNQLIINVWVYFWTLNSIPSIYMSILTSVLHCLDYSSFVVSFEMGKCEFSNVILFKIALAGTSLVVQWLRICLPMQGTRV